ncbi:MAG: transporter substrate-binding protein [Roseburia sp.]|nr:transporter substrate-binding protein [Roseburia sp.]
MRKLFKKFVAAAMAASMLFSAAACGKSEGGSADSDTIKLGLVADMSGTSANTQTLNSVTLAVNEINESGGLLGKQIEIVSVDSQSDTARYQEMGKKLIQEDQVDVLFTAGTSACREAIRPVAEENEMLYFYCNSYEGGVASRYMFLAGPVPEQTVDPLISYASENVGKKIYCLVADYNYGRVMVEWLKQKAGDYGAEVVGEEYVPQTVSDFSSSIAKIEQSDADAVFIAMVGSNMASFFDQWANAGIEDKTLMSLSNFCQYYEHKKLDPPSLEGSLTAAAYMEEFDTDASKEFVEKYRAMAPDEPYITSNCAIAYNAVYIWANAVELAGTTDTEAVIDALETQDISFDGPGGKVTVEGRTHHLYTDISVVRIDENHNAQIVETYTSVEPSYLLDMGIDLSKEDPQTQYTPLDD